MNKLITATILGSFLSCIGCHADCEGKYTTAPEAWTSSDLEILKNSFLEWNEFAGKNTVSLDENNRPGMCKIVPRHDDAHSDRLAFYYFVTGNIDVWVDRPRIDMRSVPSERSDTALKNVIKHELGHSLGLDHVESTHAIMSEKGSAYINKSSAFDVEDLRECKNAGVCL